MPNIPLPGQKKLSLADGAKMRAATGEQNPADGGAADQAGLTCPQVDAVFELEKTADAVGVNVVGD